MEKATYERPADNYVDLEIEYPGEKEKDKEIEHLNTELNRSNNIINELAFIFDDYNEFNELLEKYNYELKGSEKE